MALRPPAPEADCTIKQRDIGTRLTRQVGETGKEHRTLLERRIDERHELRMSVGAWTSAHSIGDSIPVLFKPIF
jgi:hypothetical protein